MLTGHCLCGQVTFEVDASADAVAYDHCDACQRQSGSAYSLVCVVPRSKVQVKGPIKVYKKKGDSGKDVARAFCSECGSPIYHQPDSAPDICAIKAGCFDKEIKKTLKPTIEVYTQDKLPFVKESLEKPFHGMPQ